MKTNISFDLTRNGVQQEKSEHEESIENTRKMDISRELLLTGGNQNNDNCERHMVMDIIEFHMIIFRKDKWEVLVWGCFVWGFFEMEF